MGRTFGMTRPFNTHRKHSTPGRPLLSNLAACCKCNSAKLMRKVHVKDRSDSFDHGLSAAVHEHPNALLFKGGLEGTLKATICADCGFTEFYLENPQELWPVYLQESQNRDT